MSRVVILIFAAVILLAVGSAVAMAIVDPSAFLDGVPK